MPSPASCASPAAPTQYTVWPRGVVELGRPPGAPPPPEPMLLNVNVPDRAWVDLGGLSVTRLGKRHKAESVVKTTNPRGQTVYWVGAAGLAQDAGEGTDFHAIANGFVSITPLQMDLTRFSQMDSVNAWLKL